ncbi:hypothetical protein ACX40Y_09975 [Sphingomonas sp. RS6]
MIVLISTALASLSFGTLQAEQAAQTQIETAVNADVAEKKICRRIVPTGSMLPRRFCLTKTEWTTFNRRNNEDADAALSKRINIAVDESLKPQ